MKATSQCACASDNVTCARIVLNPDQKLSTVALELVRAAAEFQNRVARNEDTTGLVAEFSTHFHVDTRLGEAMLAGKIKAEFDGDHLIVQATDPQPERFNTHPTAPCNALSVSTLDAKVRARRMHWVMRIHALACHVIAQSTNSQNNACEFLCDLRHWCDANGVDIYKAMDEAYIRYMHDKFTGLKHDSH